MGRERRPMGPREGSTYQTDVTVAVCSMWILILYNSTWRSKVTVDLCKHGLNCDCLLYYNKLMGENY